MKSRQGNVKVSDTIAISKGSCVGNKLVPISKFKSAGYFIAQARIGHSLPGSTFGYVATNAIDFRNKVMVVRDLPVFYTAFDQNLDVAAPNEITLTFSTSATNVPANVILIFTEVNGFDTTGGISVPITDFHGKWQMPPYKLKIRNTTYKVMYGEDVLSTIWTAP